MSFIPNSVYVIAEAGVNHNGDVPTALKLIDAAAKTLTAGKSVGWFRGRMESGPRALG